MGPPTEPLGLNAGLEEEIIELLRWDTPLADAGDVAGLHEPERTIIRVVRELIREPKLSREAFEAAQRIFGNQGLMDIAGLVGHYTLVNYTLKAFDVQRPARQSAHAPSRCRERRAGAGPSDGQGDTGPGSGRIR